jgi:hypothetical protein
LYDTVRIIQSGLWAEGEKTLTKDTGDKEKIIWIAMGVGEEVRKQWELVHFNSLFNKKKTTVND